MYTHDELSRMYKWIDVYSVASTPIGNWMVLKNGHEIGDSPRFRDEISAERYALSFVSCDPDNRKYVKNIN